MTPCNDSHENNSSKPSGRTLRHPSGKNVARVLPPSVRLDLLWGQAQEGCFFRFRKRIIMLCVGRTTSHWVSWALLMFCLLRVCSCEAFASTSHVLGRPVHSWSYFNPCTPCDAHKPVRERANERARKGEGGREGGRE